MTSSMIVFYPSEPHISSSNHNWSSRTLADGATNYSIVIVKMSTQRESKLHTITLLVIVKMSTQRESKLHTITLLVLTNERELELW